MREETSTANSYRLDDQVGFLLRRAQQRHVSIFASLIPELTPPQFAALAKLGELGKCPQNQLGQLVAMDAATIKGVIDRLRARRLVEVSADEHDRRRVLVNLTPEGKTTFEELTTRAAAITEKTLVPLTAREVETFTRLLAKLG